MNRPVRPLFRPAGLVSPFVTSPVVTRASPSALIALVSPSGPFLSGPQSADRSGTVLMSAPLCTFKPGQSRTEGKHLVLSRQRISEAVADRRDQPNDRARPRIELMGSTSDRQWAPKWAYQQGTHSRSIASRRRIPVDFPLSTGGCISHITRHSTLGNSYRHLGQCNSTANPCSGYGSMRFWGSSQLRV